MQQIEPLHSDTSRFKSHPSYLLVVVTGDEDWSVGLLWSLVTVLVKLCTVSIIPRHWGRHPGQLG